MIIASQNDHAEDVDRFNKFYKDNYKKICNWGVKNKIPQDTIHDSYLILVNRINKVGFEGDTFLTYIKLSIKNLHINNLKKENNRYWVDIDDSDWETTIETILLEADEFNEDNKIYQEQLLLISKALFKYLEPRYNGEYMYVFKTYYLMKKRFTYDKLTSECGMAKNKCRNIIITMKKDLRENLIKYIKENYYVE